MTRTLLVTNDFPPKLGGIQSYLDELWRRLDPERHAVLTASSDPAAAAYDARLAREGRHISRVAARTLYLPTPRARRAIDRAVARTAPDLVLYDPCVPLGLAGRRAGLPYGVVLHGAEAAIPARVPLARAALRRVLADAAVVVCAGEYPEHEAQALGVEPARLVVVPPGVDPARYAPLDPAARAAERARLGLPTGGPLVVSVGRLVPRKGLDVLIEAVGRLSSEVKGVRLAIAGDGRDAHRLRRLAARVHAPVRFLGRVSDEDKIALLASSDVFAQPCRSRWLGLEQEGFGIVFLEAAACGVPQVAGRSGGSYEAVASGATGLVVDDPSDPVAVAAALATLLGDAGRRRAMGEAARRRALQAFGYDALAQRLAEGLDAAIGGGPAAAS